MSDLTALVGIISTGVESLLATCDRTRMPYPPLDQPYLPSPLFDDATVMATTQLIVGAAAQLIASLRVPYDVVTETATGMYGTATMAFVNDNNIADLLKEAGPEGLHAREIGRKIGANPNYVARALRYLSTRHIFREVRPNVFANNMHSSVLVKARTFDELATIDPFVKYDGAPFSAVLNICTDEAFSGAQCMATFFKDPQGYKSCFNMSIKDNTNLFDWFHHPDRLWRAQRFSSAMGSAADRWPLECFSEALDWNALPAGSTVVDVGGNTGSVTMAIARAAPKLQYIVQDLPPVVEIARKHWESNWPEAVSSGTVKFEAHNFFEPMSTVADIYFLRSVIHDWTDEDSRKILSNIRAAAKPTSKLILFELEVHYACKKSPKLHTVNGDHKLRGVPYPLLENLGLGMGGHTTYLDLQLLSILGGQERTADDYAELGKSAGWLLESVKPGPIAAFIFTPLSA